MATLNVFSKGGYLLYSSGRVEGGALNKLVAEHILESRAGSEFTAAGQTIKWRQDNDRGVVYALSTPTVLQLRHLDDALDRIYRSFSKQLDEANRAEQTYDFKAQFDRALAAAEEKMETAKETQAFDAAAAAAKKAAGRSAMSSSSESGDDIRRSSDNDKSSSAGASSSASGGALSQEEIRKRIMKRSGGGGKKTSSSSKSPSKTEKTARKWGGAEAKLSKEEKAALSKSKEGADDLSAIKVGEGRVEHYNLDLEMDSDEDFSDEDDAADAAAEQAKAGQGKRGFFGNLLRGLTGRNLDEEDLAPVLDDLRDHLIRKNVASDVAGQICESVKTSLMGKQLGSLSSVSKLVRDAVRVALVKILTPKRAIDILVDVEQANRVEGRLYTVVFVGINGVGKSTNLAKVASWLLSNKKKVMIAACDTFRSGAVEQLAVHCRALDVPLFQQGYGNDAATIAQFAVRDAAKNGQDVVLIDTAGRMQDNERLMQALAKLVQVNRPDLILFVGEALAGNDAVDQLQKFNEALSDFSGSDDPRLVDGIILSKVDTVDDQVGTAVSLSYSSKLPIVFCGVGQQYGDLKKLSVDNIVKALLK